jgi:hypothetical protein
MHRILYFYNNIHFLSISQLSLGTAQKPLGMDGFFVEYEVDTKDINLYYKYPSKITLFIMPVLGFWGVPNAGWELSRKDSD